MATDLNALKQMLNKFKKRSEVAAERDAILWKPKAGKQVIRIVPRKDNPQNPFIELYFHYLGKKTLLSPTSFGKRDPIAEFAELIKEDESREYKERMQEAREFEPKPRTYVPVIVRGEEDKGVRYYPFGVTVLRELLSYFNDEDYGDLADPEKGRDITLEYIPKPSPTSKELPKTELKVKPVQTPLSTDPALKEKWLTEQPNLLSLYEEHSYDELKNELEKFLEPASVSTASADDSSEAESVPVSVTETVATPSVSVKNVADEFDKLFNS